MAIHASILPWEIPWTEEPGGFCLVAKYCPTLCDPMGYSSWNSPGKNTGVGSLSLLQQISLTQELNWGLLHYRSILLNSSFQLGYQGSLFIIILEKYLLSSLKYHCVSRARGMPNLVSYRVFPNSLGEGVLD